MNDSLVGADHVPARADTRVRPYRVAEAQSGTAASLTVWPSR